MIAAGGIMVHNDGDIVDRISGLPDDVLVDILGRLVTAGDVGTVTRTSILSRRWRSLPWRQITNKEEWVPVRQGRRHRFWYHHEGTAAFTAALANFLADPPSTRVINKLSLKFVLTKRDLIGAAVDAGAVRNVELEIVTELTCKTTNKLQDMIGLVRDYPALESLHVRACGLLRRAQEPAGDVLTVDAPPESRLRTLVLDPLFAWWRLSEILVDTAAQIQTLTCGFHQGNKIWLQPEHPRELMLSGLKKLHLTDISPGCNLSWTLFLLEAAPLLESLNIQIFDHICTADRRRKRDLNTKLKWQPSPGFMHRNLKKLTFNRAFHFYKDLRFAKLIMELTVNLEALTMGVKSLECVAAEPNFPDFAGSRSRFAGNTAYVDTVVKKLKDGISTSAQITILLPDDLGSAQIS
ncbi:hypothetical protein QOZ80_2AG0149580 [Eleusine coracana subsp. coracana]|nr:hypothetical protein QOZ80_2AG0149580 [Eleusine coracana subsp. coracana]